MTTLPIDPTTISPEDIGEHRATLDMDHDDAIEHVREAFGAAGFGVAVEFSVSDLLREKIGVEREPYYVLGACNPQVANRALDASDGRIGGLFACNVVIWEAEPGRQEIYHVSIMKVARLVGMAPDDDAWAEIVDETGNLVTEAWSNLETV
jgi:uncharacterized protein (DUF302 family)